MQVKQESAKNQRLTRPLGKPAGEISVPLGKQPCHLPLWQLLVQAFVHSTHHRGKLSVCLRNWGGLWPFKLW